MLQEPEPVTFGGSALLEDVKSCMHNDRQHLGGDRNISYGL